MTSTFSKFLAGLLAVVALTLVWAGCGSSSDAEPLTKAEFIAKGDAVCQRAEREKKVKIEAFLAKSDLGPGKGFDEKENEAFVSTAVVPPIKGMGEELEDLGVPDEQAAEDVVDGLMTVVGELEDDPALLTTSSGKDPFADVAKKAGDYGFKVCILYY